MKIGEKNMEENTQEKDLIEKKESFFNKVKNFFKGLFKKKVRETTNDTVNNEAISVNENNSFKDDIKVVEEEQSEEMKIIELQRRYRRGEIAENDLTEEQIEALSDLYDRQIEALRKVIEEKEQQITEQGLERKERVRTNDEPVRD